MAEGRDGGERGVNTSYQRGMKGDYISLICGMLAKPLELYR